MPPDPDSEKREKASGKPSTDALDGSVTENREFEKNLSRIIHAMAIPAFVMDNTHVVRYWNRACEKLTGISAEEMVGTRDAWRAFYRQERPLLADIVIDGSRAEDVGAYYDIFKPSELADDAFEVQRFFPDLGDTGKWLFFTASPLRNDAGRIIGAIETFQDITAQKRAEQHHLLLLRAIPDPVVVYDRTGRTTYVNHAFEQTYGWRKDELIGSTIDFVPDEEVGPTREAWRRTLEGEKVFFETLRKTRAGDTLNVQMKTAVLKDQNGSHQASIVIHRDVTTIKQAEAEREQLIRKLNRLATTDALTGAHNRRCFFEKARQEFKRAGRYSSPFAFLMIDIDFFKSVNDTYGHQTGDRALQEVVKKSCSILRENDLFGRIGGEEFAAILVQTERPHAAGTAERLRSEIEKMKVDTGKGPASLTVSIGLTVLERDDRELETIFKRADQALYQAKARGRNRVVTL